MIQLFKINITDFLQVPPPRPNGFFCAHAHNTTPTMMAQSARQE
jgi:hypothetical protein